MPSGPIQNLGGAEGPRRVTLALDCNLCPHLLLSLLTCRNRACLNPQGPVRADQPTSQYQVSIVKAGNSCAHRNNHPQTEKQL